MTSEDKEEKQQDAPSSIKQACPNATKNHQSPSAAAEATSSPARSPTHSEAGQTSDPTSQHKRKMSKTALDDDSTAPASASPQPRRSKRICHQLGDQPKALHPRPDQSPT
ncbi:hypothetical protein E4U55_006749 [Claviceps digitariae]|nr:hypothetical protein E4U55_006749 [Claviceps digitariae]